jgi:hypothetical protein
MVPTMAECKILVSCHFCEDELAYLPQTAEFMRSKYCHGDSEKCARYRVATEGVQPPADLFPNQSERVRAVLNRYGKEASVK